MKKPKLKLPPLRIGNENELSAEFLSTEKISAAFINNLPGTFLPSQIQKEVDKQYELRVFFLEEEWYSMAIFSQESAATDVDSRKNFEAKCMPRGVPYLLSGDIKTRLRLLLESSSFCILISN